MSGVAAAAASSRRWIILTRDDVNALMDTAGYLEAAETGFRAGASGAAWAPSPLHLHGEGGAFHAKAAGITLDRTYAALKLNGNSPQNPVERGLPTIQGAILLCDGADGSLLAIIDTIAITDGRTAAASALAARHLARSDSQAILLCGCGAQARAQLAALRAVLPLTSAFAWDRDAERAQAFAATESRSDSTVTACEDLAGAAHRSDVIITCTTPGTPFLDESMVGPGTFIAVVGADSADKSEITAQLMARSAVVADVIEQCVVMGDLYHAIAAGLMSAEDAHGDLGGLLTGRVAKPPTDAITIFDSTGTALQDVAAAVMVYRRALASGQGSAVALEGEA